MKKYTLILDTATKNIYLGLLCDGSVVEESIVPGEKNHASRAIVLIEELFSRHQITMDDVEKLVVGIGPGSFTGVRVGLTIMKTFAFTKSIPLYTISTLYLMSSGYEEDHLVYIDARRGNGFGAYYKEHQEYIPEGFYSLFELQEKAPEANAITEDTMKVSGIKVVEHATYVDNVQDLVPNYLRGTSVEQKGGN